MPRSRFRSRSKHKLSFKNRRRILETVSSHYEKLCEDGAYLRVVTIVGFGGSGKSRLLSHLRTKAQNMGLETISITLEAEASSTSIAPLKAIRDQLQFDCMLFDIALIRYWAASGQIAALSSSADFFENRIFKVAGEILNLTGALSLPMEFAVESYKKVRKIAVKQFRYNEEDFRRVDSLKDSPEELLEQLPFFLALDIESRFTQDSTRYVFFYDSYEKQSAKTLSANADWLREFIGTLDRGVHVIAGREGIVWPYSEWREVTDPALEMEPLPEDDVRALFVEMCAPSDAVLEHLVETSQRIPFYVEVLVADYLRLKEKTNEVTIEDLPSRHSQVLERFLSHYDPAIKKLVASLAAIQFFDRGMISGIIRGLNLPIDLIEAEKTLDFFFVEQFDDGYEIYKTHDLLTEYVRQSDEYANHRASALKEACNYLSVRTTAGCLPSSCLPFYLALCGLLNAVQDVDGGSVELVIDIGYALYDGGYWRELRLPQAKAENWSSDRGDLVAEYFSALSERRVTSVERGLSRLRNIEPNKLLLGKHGASFELELGYVVELSGNYKGARELFGLAFEKNGASKPSERHHFMANLHYADLLIMDGQFNKGANLLLESASFYEEERNVYWAELSRHRGHALRFSWLLEQAEFQYMQILNSGTPSLGMAGKIYTNLAETRCWTTPDIALEDAARSIDANLKLGNTVELCKAESARAVAYIKLGELDAAKRAISFANRYSKESNYVAGELFALVALCAFETAQGHIPRAEQVHLRAQRMVQQLDTYNFLCCATGFLAEDPTSNMPVFESFDWIQPKEAHNRMCEILSSFLG